MECISTVSMLIPVCAQDACLRFIGYYNLNKIKYYIGSLLGKGMIEVAEVINGYNRYKISILGLSVINDISRVLTVVCMNGFRSIIFVFKVFLLT